MVREKGSTETMIDNALTGAARDGCTPQGHAGIIGAMQGLTLMVGELSATVSTIPAETAALVQREIARLNAGAAVQPAQGPFGTRLMSGAWRTVQRATWATVAALALVAWIGDRAGLWKWLASGPLKTGG